MHTAASNRSIGYYPASLLIAFSVHISHRKKEKGAVLRTIFDGRLHSRRCCSRLCIRHRSYVKSRARTAFAFEMSIDETKGVHLENGILRVPMIDHWNRH